MSILLSIRQRTALREDLPSATKVLSSHERSVHPLGLTQESPDRDLVQVVRPRVGASVRRPIPFIPMQNRRYVLHGGTPRFSPSKFAICKIRANASLTNSALSIWNLRF